MSRPATDRALALALLLSLAACTEHAPPAPAPALPPLALALPAERAGALTGGPDGLRAAVVTIETDRGFGSAFVVTAEGHLMTNQHVVAGGGPLSARLADGRRLPAVLLRADAARDVALLKLEAGGPLPALPLRRHPAEPGEPCFAVGTPERPERAGTITAGRITGIERAPTPAGRQALVYATAAVAPGSSGGPLVDAAGNVLGITWDQLSAGGVPLFWRFVPIGEALDRLALTGASAPP